MKINVTSKSCNDKFAFTKNGGKMVIRRKDD